MSNQRIKELETKINQARLDYYNGQAKISDKVYDTMVDELFTLDPKNPAVIGIGADPVSNWEKFKHLTPMGSLNKTHTDEEYLAWHNKYFGPNDEAFVTLKLDGLSVSLIYENGVLVNGASRGSGSIGEKITANVARMIGVPLRLTKKVDITVRGEMLLSKENHKRYFSEYSNTRNGASGISRKYDGEGCNKLSVLVYQLFSDDPNIKTQEDQFIELESLGFITPTSYVVKTAKDVIALKNEYQASLRDQFGYDLDGMVVSINDLDKQQSFGALNGRPYGQMAMKFESVAKEAYVSDIIVQCGNSGRITPVAVFNPKVSLMGADVEKASLHNFSNIASLGIDIGATVLVCRSGDVIPFVEEVVQSTGTIFEPPTHCSECGTMVIETGEYVQCPNTAGCPAQKVGRLINWIKEIGVLEWGTILLEKLVSSGLVVSVADLYKLSVKDLSHIDRMGQKSAQKCYDNLHADTAIPLEVFLGGLSIPFIGQSTIKAIMAAGCNTITKFGQLHAANFEQVPGIGPVRAQSLADGLKNYQDVILDLFANGVSIKEIKMGKLTGSSFCFTGKMVHKRVEWEKMVSNEGGLVKDSVGAGLSYLVINEASNSSKAIKAQKLGTKLINEEELLEMMR
jgi:DNA ligase (NAD+)